MLKKAGAANLAAPIRMLLMEAGQADPSMLTQAGIMQPALTEILARISR